jgi:hypothetical protein
MHGDNIMAALENIELVASGPTIETTIHEGWRDANPPSPCRVRARPRMMKHRQGRRSLDAIMTVRDRPSLIPMIKAGRTAKSSGARRIDPVDGAPLVVRDVAEEMSEDRKPAIGLA